MDENRQIFFYKNYFLDFYSELPESVQRKIDWTLKLISTTSIIPKKYFKHLSGSSGLYEIRVEVRSNVFRIFCCFDEGNLVILFNGFQKKSQKTPRLELERAERIRQEYFSEK